MLTNGPPSFCSVGLESIFSNFSRITHLSKSSTIMALGCTFRVAGGNVLSGTRIRAAVVKAGSSGCVATDWEFLAAAEEFAVEDLGL